LQHSNYKKFPFLREREREREREKINFKKKFGAGVRCQNAAV